MTRTHNRVDRQNRETSIDRNIKNYIDRRDKSCTTLLKHELHMRRNTVVPFNSTVAEDATQITSV